MRNNFDWKTLAHLCNSSNKVPCKIPLTVLNFLMATTGGSGSNNDGGKIMHFVQWTYERVRNFSVFQFDSLTHSLLILWLSPTYAVPNTRSMYIFNMCAAFLHRQWPNAPNHTANCYTTYNNPLDFHFLLTARRPFYKSFLLCAQSPNRTSRIQILQWAIMPLIHFLVLGQLPFKHPDHYIHAIHVCASSTFAVSASLRHCLLI